MDINQIAERITALERAFRKFTKNVPGFRVDVVGYMSGNANLVHPVAGFEIRLQPQNTGAGVSLYVSESYAELTRWSEAGHEIHSGGAWRERFHVSFGDGYYWGESTFDSPDELAHELLGYMQFNLDAVS